MTVDERPSGSPKGVFDAYVLLQVLVHCHICLPDFGTSLTF